jgi:hypothetical protein
VAFLSSLEEIMIDAQKADLKVNHQALNTALEEHCLNLNLFGFKCESLCPYIHINIFKVVVI